MYYEMSDAERIEFLSQKNKELKARLAEVEQWHREYVRDWPDMKAENEWLREALEVSRRRAGG